MTRPTPDCECVQHHRFQFPQSSEDLDIQNKQAEKKQCIKQKTREETKVQCKQKRKNRSKPAIVGLLSVSFSWHPQKKRFVSKLPSLLGKKNKAALLFDRRTSSPRSVEKKVFSFDLSFFDDSVCIRKSAVCCSSSSRSAIAKKGRFSPVFNLF